MDTRADDATAETPRPARRSGRARRRRVTLFRRTLDRTMRAVGAHLFTSLTRRIVFLNLAGLAALVSGILYLNQFRAGLIDARVESLLIQGEIISAAIAASASVDTNQITIDPDELFRMQANRLPPPVEDPNTALDFSISPERVAPVLRRLISPTKTRARILDRDGTALLDSRHLYGFGDILRFDPPDEPEPEQEGGPIARAWTAFERWFRESEFPIAREGTGLRSFPEVERALNGSPASIVRVTDRGELVVSVAVPILRARSTVGVLLLSTQGDDIDAILRAERMAILRVFLVAAAVMVVLSVLLAGTIAGPMRRLAAAADRVRRGVKAREEFPDFSDRRDEIGHLARAFSDMTAALYKRMDAIEAFAADVAHELKNPLTSVRSAVETLPLARSDESRKRLLDIIQHDVKRLDRLISDISDASRLDAELSREDSEPVDMARLVETVVSIQRELVREGGPTIELTIARAKSNTAYMMLGHDSRIGQVVTNLVDNARSFSPPGSTVRVRLRRLPRDILLTVEDEGPGIRPDQFDRIFERFYTDRPEGEGFGNNSGLGLSISKQIVEAHRGRIRAENRLADVPGPADLPDGGETEDGCDDAAPADTAARAVLGARFVVRLPAMIQ